jgi:hypothetical protein
VIAFIVIGVVVAIVLAAKYDHAANYTEPKAAPPQQSDWQTDGPKITMQGRLIGVANNEEQARKAALNHNYSAIRTKWVSKYEVVYRLDGAKVFVARCPKQAEQFVAEHNRTIPCSPQKNKKN